MRAHVLVGGLCILSAGAAWGQTSGPAGEFRRENPNVPAITGDRQQVPMGGGGLREGSVPSQGVVSGEQRPRLREYALRQREKEFRFQQDITVGTVLPSEAQLIDVPSEYNVQGHRLALVNQKTVLVEPGSRRIVDVLD